MVRHIVPYVFYMERRNMYLDKYIEENLKEYEARISELEKLIAALPPGVLHICRNGKYFSWRVLMPDGSETYLPRKEEKTARLLSQKRVYLAELHDLKNEAESCRRYLRYSASSVNALEKLYTSSNSEFRRLGADSFKNPAREAAEWEEADYTKSTAYPEQIIVPTVRNGEKVRSKLEANVAGILCTLKIPYKYEMITLIGGIKIAVDFTALDVRTLREIPIELFGMMDNPDYIKTYNKKMITYINAGYIPGINFLTFYESPADPLNPMFIRKTLEDFFFKNPPRQF